jgi:hypothetical protein
MITPEEVERLQNIERAARNPALVYDFACPQRDEAWKDLKVALDGPPGSKQARLAAMEMRMSRLEDFVREYVERRGKA